MPTMWDMIAESILKQAGPLVEDLMPKIKDIVYDQTMRALRDFHATDPIPITDPIPTPLPTGEPLVIADMDLIPERMRRAGFQGSDGAMWYGLAHIMAYGPDAVMPDDGAGSMRWLNAHRLDVCNWFTGELTLVQRSLQGNLSLTAIAIANDGPTEQHPGERLGFRLGPAIMERMKEFGDRVQLGTVVTESEY